jgi:sugar lactone lactonase YvrE
MDKHMTRALSNRKPIFGWFGLFVGVMIAFVGILPTATAQTITVQRVATGLENPRGIAVMPDGRLVVVEAGTGLDSIDPLDDSGKLSIFDDLNGDGDYDDDGEITRLFSHIPSYNALTKFGTQRDEVGGAGDVLLLDDGRIFYTNDDPFEIISIVKVTPEGSNIGNLLVRDATMNALAYDPATEMVYVAESGANRLSAVNLDGEDRVITEFPRLAHDQQPVPSGIAFDARTGDILVTLFSGQIWDYYESTLAFMPGDSKVVRVDPATGDITDEITGLTTAVDVAIDEAGNIYVAQLTTVWPAAPMPPKIDLFDPNIPPDAGGYARFTGRVSLYPADDGEPVILADRLDAPPNITYADGVLYISVGQGTPGRSIIGSDGLTQITGEIYRITGFR